MSMLAEPRRRRNYVLTPRGKPLYDDDSRFGSKMLQKMGWSKGKGLGAKESGETDFVRVNFKSDAGGLGFENRDDQWTQHEHGFNGLLQSLNAQTEDDKSKTVEEDVEEDGLQTTGFGFKSEKKSKVKVALSGESLEEKSKQSKARVHYKKFTKGKDLSQYSEKDLANIFGKKALDTDNVAVDSVEKNSPELFKSKSTSIADYFKEKMEKRKGNQMEIEKDLIPVQSKGDNLLKSSSSSISDYFKQKMEERKSKQGIQVVEQENRNTDNKVECDEEPIRKKRKKEKKHSVKDSVKETLPESYCPVGEKRKKRKRKEVENLPDDVSSETGPVLNSKDCQKQNDIINNDTKTTVATENSKNCKKNNPLALQNGLDELKTPTLQQNLNLDVSVKLIKKANPKNSKNNPEPLKEDVDKELNVYTISSYVAEKFRRAEFEKFTGSNLKDMNGYSFDENVKLNIIQSLKDEKRIIKFWEGAMDKYSGCSRAKKVHTASKDASANKNTKYKNKKRSSYIRKHKRKNAFKVGI